MYKNENENELRHVAFIMDGNGRWAKKRGFPRTLGHKKGGEAFRTVARACKNAKIPYVTFFAFSTENIKRPKEEVDTLFGLFREYLFDAEKYAADKTRILFPGDRSIFPPDMIQQMNKLERESAGFDEMTLSLCLNYGGRADIIQAAKKFGQLCRDKDLRPENLDEKIFSGLLYTKDIPDVDLLIRTGGEQRLSNFLLWQLCYAELMFTDTLWPDFGEKDLLNFVNIYKTRDRRFGEIK
ncbi:MAG: di-trans,poly-cis-decaprenylcistransferase [Ruminococcus sp.]|jgi:undecaprenyl diphosphate synthase|nr:di-trans,poly-cis-decaprenylcistransferase [Ruminococcus sp.]